MKKLIAFLLVIYPILNIYCLPYIDFLPIGSIVCLLVLFFLLFTRKKSFDFKLPDGFKIFWIYISLVYLLFADSFRIGLFIPGGMSFFMWVVLFWLCNNFFDYKSFKKYYRAIFLICSFAFLFQEFFYYTLGNRPLFMLPLPFYHVNKAEILLNQALLNRSSGFFLEPAHFAQFAIPLLCIEIFENSKGKIINAFAVYIIFILLLLQSGNGVVGILVLFFIRIISFFRESNSRYKFLSYILFISISVLCVYNYVETEIGQGIMERASNVGQEDSDSSIRLVNGYLLYSEIPNFNKIFGFHIDKIIPFAAASKFSYLFIEKNSGEFGVYLNGIQHLLIVNGLVGTMLLLRVYIKLYLKNNLLAKSLIIIFFVLMFIANLYIGQMMLICTLIPYLSKSESEQTAAIKSKRISAAN